MSQDQEADENEFREWLRTLKKHILLKAQMSTGAQLLDIIPVLTSSVVAIIHLVENLPIEAFKEKK